MAKYILIFMVTHLITTYLYVFCYVFEFPYRVLLVLLYTDNRYEKVRVWKRVGTVRFTYRITIVVVCKL